MLLSYLQIHYQKAIIPEYTTIEIHQDNIHAKIESKLSATTYLNREINHILRHN